MNTADIVCVIPPGAQLTPSSTINNSMLGKVPGKRLANGMWAGYDWRHSVTTDEDVRRWRADGANLGLRADAYPGLDIDCTDPALSRMIAAAAVSYLGPAPVRVGRAPKCLLQYRTDEPFPRMRLWIKMPNGEQHLVELLGRGQQYVIEGTHPVTLRPYVWSDDARELTTITRETAEAFFTHLTTLLDALDIGIVERSGSTDGSIAADQEGLVAPNLVWLRDAVAVIPNDDRTAPQRDDYVKMAYAIRAACGEDEEEGFAIFAEWASRHERDGRVAGNPATWLSDWRRTKSPYKVGWNFIADVARGYGFDTTSLDFDVLDAAPPAPLTSAPSYSDQWLADIIAVRLRGVLRNIPQEGKYLCWTGARWQRDAELLAEDNIKRELRVIANETAQHGATDSEKRRATELAVQFCSAGKCTSVAQLLRSERTIAVSMSSIDHDPWLLNTPAGIVDLRTGELGASEPDALCTKMTTVAPDFDTPCPTWWQFLFDTTGGDSELIDYLHRLSGYCLTGVTHEQTLSFIHGPGGNGKGTFINAIAGIMGDYHTSASMTTFTASQNERHSTDIAMLVGARLVTASETEAGKRWDEARVKNLTGGDPITARFMRMDNFTYMPQFKLLFIGNHQPEVRDVDEAMKRRVQMVPFIIKPKVRDNFLADKLRAEWPSILGWMIRGCLAWQKTGLRPPGAVLASTDTYFADEDAVGRWIAERCDEAPDIDALTQELFDSWREWANQNGEYVGSLKRFSAALVSRGLRRFRESATRRRGFVGLRVLPQLGVLP